MADSFHIKKSGTVAANTEAAIAVAIGAPAAITAEVKSTAGVQFGIDSVGANMVGPSGGLINVTLAANERLHVRSTAEITFRLHRIISA